MQAGDEAGNGSPTLRIGERHASGARKGEAEIAKAILPIDFCSHRSASGTSFHTPTRYGAFFSTATMYTGNSSPDAMRSTSR